MYQDLSRLLHTVEFPITEIPDLPCPACHSGQLIGQKESFRLIQSEESKKLEQVHFQGGWDTNYGTFSGLLSCNRPRCNQFVFITGKYNIQQNFLDTENEMGYPNTEIVPFLCPQFFQPVIQLLRLHHQVPNSIREAFSKSFEQFWLDHDACGNKLRIVVELLMNEQGIEPNHTLDKRIRDFQRIKSEDLGTIILAVKWIGNGGSHGASSLTRADVVVAMEMLEHVTKQLYDTATAHKARQLQQYSTQVNLNKGPIEKRQYLLPPPPPVAP